MGRRPQTLPEATGTGGLVADGDEERDAQPPSRIHDTRSAPGLCSSSGSRHGPLSPG
jgi:hypothetical protein